MKVCLINPRGLDSSSFFTIPHGLLHIQAELKRAGHDVEIVDFADPETSVSYDRFKRYDAVGLSVMTTQLQHALEIADALGRKVPVIWGGVHCVLDPLSLLRKYPNHFVISGEGEQVLVRPQIF